MKTLTHLVLVACALSLTACNFSAGKKKDFSTGLSVSNSGLSLDEAYLVGPDNTALNTNEVAMNSKIAIVAQGVENYVLKDGKAFPGLMLTVTDPEGIAVLDEPDLLNNNEGYSPADAAILRGSVTVGSPMKSGEIYHVKMRIWDHNKPENEIIAEVDIKVL